MSNKMFLNLLPWRLYQHRQKRKTLLLVTLASLILFVGYSYLLYSKTSKLNQHKQLLQQQQEQTKQTLIQIQQQIRQARSQLSHQSQQYIDYNVLNQILVLTSQLPLIQGELTLLKLTYQESELTLILQGNTPEQEFEAIHQLLKQQDWLPQIKLTEFIPQAKQQIKFEFHLLINIKG